MQALTLPPIPQRALNFALGVTVRFALALVVQFLAPGDSDIDLGLAAIQANPQGNQRLALFTRASVLNWRIWLRWTSNLRGLSLTWFVWLMRIWLDGGAEQPQLTVLDARIRFAD